jgi:hypothetical protein
MRIPILTDKRRSGLASDEDSRVFVASIDAPSGTEAFWNLYFETDPPRTLPGPEQVAPNLLAAVRRAYEVIDVLWEAGG